MCKHSAPPWSPPNYPPYTHAHPKSHKWGDDNNSSLLSQDVFCSDIQASEKKKRENKKMKPRLIKRGFDQDCWAIGVEGLDLQADRVSLTESGVLVRERAVRGPCTSHTAREPRRQPCSHNRFTNTCWNYCRSHLDSTDLFWIKCADHPLASIAWLLLQRNKSIGYKSNLFYF